MSQRVSHLARMATSALVPLTARSGLTRVSTGTGVSLTAANCTCGTVSLVGTLRTSLPHDHTARGTCDRCVLKVQESEEMENKVAENVSVEVSVTVAPSLIWRPLQPSVDRTHNTASRPANARSLYLSVSCSGDAALWYFRSILVQLRLS